MDTGHQEGDFIWLSDWPEFVGWLCREDREWFRSALGKLLANLGRWRALSLF